MKNKSQKNKNIQKQKKPKQESSYSFFPNEDQIYEIKSNLTKKNILLFSIIFSLILMIIFQFKYEYDRKYSSSNNEYDMDHYFKILGLEPGEDIKEIRKAYKKLSKIWHPDKHPNCQSCKEKFLKISEAHEILTKNENSNKNFYFKSHPIILTLKNYHNLVEKSNDFWIIFVYEGGREKYIQHFISIFDEISSKFKSIIKFGIIDAIKQENLLTFLPFKFPILPAIYTHLTGEINEFYSNIDSINELNLIEFMEKSYFTKIQLLNNKEIKKFYNEKNKKKNFNYISDIKQTLELKFFILSSKNKIELVSRDFYNRYKDYCEIYQNDLGYYDDSLKIFNETKNYKIYISYNNIENNNVLNKVIEPIPIPIKLYDDFSKKLQISFFEYGKKIIMPEIFKNNFLQHCTSKYEFISNKKDLNEIENERIFIDLCIIKLNDNDEDVNLKNDINLILYENIINNFKNNLKYASNNKHENVNNNNLNINYGYVNLKKNKKLKKLYEKIMDKKNITKKQSSKFLIIDSTNEKFTFKLFDNKNNAKEYLKNINEVDFFEDISLGFEYFSDYNVNEINSLFNEIKIFLISNIISMALNCQKQPSYVVLFILIYISTMYILKYNSTKAFWFTIRCITISIIIHFILFSINSYYF